MLCVYPASPMLLPCTVTLADPVPALFVRRITLSPPVSTDHTSVTLPDLDPAVTDTRRLPFKPCITWHRTDVSASQCVASHAECPARMLCVYPASPMLLPCTVTLADPVPALFV